MDSYMASNGSCVHGRLDYYQKPPLGSRPTTKRETMALQTLTTVGLFHSTMCESPLE